MSSKSHIINFRTDQVSRFEPRSGSTLERGGSVIRSFRCKTDPIGGPSVSQPEERPTGVERSPTKRRSTSPCRGGQESELPWGKGPQEVRARRSTGESIQGRGTSYQDTYLKDTITGPSEEGPGGPDSALRTYGIPDRSPSLSQWERVDGL